MYLNNICRSTNRDTRSDLGADNDRNLKSVYRGQRPSGHAAQLITKGLCKNHTSDFAIPLFIYNKRTKFCKCSVSLLSFNWIAPINHHFHASLGL